VNQWVKNGTISKAFHHDFYMGWVFEDHAISGTDLSDDFSMYIAGGEL